MQAGEGEKAADASTAPADRDRVSSIPIPGVDILSDDDLGRLNKMLPWAAFVLDSHGREFGSAYSATKRNVPQQVPDYRIVELNRRMNLAGLTVLEIGCFEGIHTVALAMMAGRVLACDSRVENVIKTIVRCALYKTNPDVFVWDVEGPPPTGAPLDCDVLHHVGVLYHLTDPVGHLLSVLPHVRKGIMLDTHIAPEHDDGEVKEYQSGGRSYRYAFYRERGREPPFAGMKDHAKWLFKDDIVEILRHCGFARIDVRDVRDERFGLRMRLFAER